MRRDLDLIVVLSVLQFLVLAVLREPSVKLMDNEQRGEHSSANQQSIHRRVLSDVPKPNINIHLGIGGTMRPQAPVLLSNSALAYCLCKGHWGVLGIEEVAVRSWLLYLAHSITSRGHRLHITSTRAARFVPDTA